MTVISVMACTFLAGSKAERRSLSDTRRRRHDAVRSKVSCRLIHHAPTGAIGLIALSMVFTTLLGPLVARASSPFRSLTSEVSARRTAVDLSAMTIQAVVENLPATRASLLD